MVVFGWIILVDSVFSLVSHILNFKEEPKNIAISALVAGLLVGTFTGIYLFADLSVKILCIAAFLAQAVLLVFNCRRELVKGQKPFEKTIKIVAVIPALVFVALAFFF